MMQVQCVSSNDYDSWLHFVHSIFSEEKQVSLEYFKDHLYCDPNTTWIYVLIVNNEWIGTCRVFSRKVYIHSSEIMCFGIGEVTIKKEHRNKGYASYLLNYIHSIHKNNQLFVLYSSNKIYQQYVYGKIGYKPICNQIFSTIVTIANQIDNQHSFEKINVMQEWKPFQEIYQQCYMVHGNLSVCRNELEYWNLWIASEIKRRNYSIIGIFKNKQMIGYFIYQIINNNTILCIEYLNKYPSKESTNHFLNYLLQVTNQTSLVIKGLQLYWREYFSTPLEVVEEYNCMIKSVHDITVNSCIIHPLDKF